jgi:large repetitive protein
MKKMFLLFLMLFGPIVGFAQNSNSVTVTVVPPPSWTITVSPGNYYQNKAATMTITVTAGPVVNTCTATWDSTPLGLTFPSSLTNPVALTAAVTAAMTATTGSHTVFISCPLPVLTLNTPVALPNGVVGKTYSANLGSLTGLTGGIPPYSWSLSSGALPTGLSLSSSGVVSGTPSGVGSFNWGFTVKDSSGLALFVHGRRKSNT